MNSDINKASHNYIGYIENNPVCFFSVLHFPHPKVKNFKKGHRLVVLPDYQGLGIGHKFSSEIAQMYLDKGFRFIITSSTKSLFTQRKNDKNWIITRKSRVGSGSGSGSLHNKANKDNFSVNKITYGYEYLGNNNSN
jgi:GNAT superfamily N-acetyltransferase